MKRTGKFLITDLCNESFVNYESWLKILRKVKPIVNVFLARQVVHCGHFGYIVSNRRIAIQTQREVAKAGKFSAPGLPEGRISVCECMGRIIEK